TVDAAGAVSVIALSSASISATAFGVAVGVTTGSGSTSVNVNATVAVTINEISNTTRAEIIDSDTATPDTVTAGGPVTLSATETGSIIANAVSVSASINVSSSTGASVSVPVTAAVARNTISNTTRAAIIGVDTDAAGSVSLTALSA